MSSAVMAGGSALETEKVAGHVEAFRKGAENAAGFNGVEMRVANGYRLDRSRGMAATRAPIVRSKTLLGFLMIGSLRSKIIVTSRTR